MRKSIFTTVSILLFLAAFMAGISVPNIIDACYACLLLIALAAVAWVLREPGAQ